jgi:hypothetical protein
VNVVLIEYSEVYYSREAAIPVPARRSGKFVQIRNETTEYLVLAPKEFAPYHADIVERFCRGRGLRGARNGEGKRFDIREPGWAVVGGGKFELDSEKKYIRFYDDSMAYGKFDSRGLKGKILSVAELSDFIALVE